MRVRTHHDRAIMCRLSFFTKEYGFHSLTEEPLTLFPDVVRCPPSTAPLAPIGFALLVAGLGDERELVGGGQCRERGT
jgi:hypothetical protein